MNKIKWGVFLGTLLFVVKGYSPCTLTLSNITSPVNFTLNPTPGAQTFRINKANNGQSCSYFIGITKGSASNYTRKMYATGGYTIDFNIRKTTNLSDPVIKTYPDTNLSTEVFAGSFPSGAPRFQTLTFYPTTTAWSTSNNHRYGVHTDTLVIQAFESILTTSPGLVPEATANIVFTYTVPKNALVSLLDVGQPYTDPAVATKTLNFPSMVQGQTVSFDMVLVYNAGYSVSFQSTHLQRLKHNSLNSYVPYTVSMTGVGSFPSLASGSPIVVTSGSGVSPSAPTGDRRTVTFTLGSIANAFAGSYSESIQITMTSTE